MEFYTQILKLDINKYYTVVSSEKSFETALPRHRSIYEINFFKFKTKSH